MADKIIAVVGATGAQGGGLVRAILNDPNSGFKARAITRDVNSDNAKALADMGAEVVSGDLNDVDSMKKAFSGAYGAFCVSFFWDHFSPDKEKASAKVMAEAAKAANCEHVIWSTFEDTRDSIPLADDRMPTLMGKYKVAHFDAKAEANDYFTELGLPVTFLLTSFYWENFIYFGLQPQRGEDGKLALTIPIADKKMPSMTSEDIGKSALGIFNRGSEFIGKTVGVAGEHLTGAQMAASFTNALGEEVGFNAVPADMFRSFGFPGAEDMGNMFQFKAEFEDLYCGNRNLNVVRSLNPDLMTFDQWLAENKDRIPVK